MGAIIGAVVVVVIVSAVAVYLGMQYVSPPEEPEEEPEKPTVEMPLAGVRAAVASREGVSQNDVKVYFCVPAEETENKNFATGVVVSNQKSIVFVYDNSTGTITTVENEYNATTSDELQAMSTIALKGVTSPYAQDHLGHFNSNKIVPFGIVKTNSSYTFEYYDGYVEYPVDLWGHGTATLESGAVTFITHEWIG